ncbi:MAG TPA: hypothetical protein VKH19_06440 [Gemmatimonadaceae bacterium]|nr:hypothetical protein [Gemmatimonadaceae bacterium]
MFRSIRLLPVAVVVVVLSGGRAQAQTPAADPSVKLRQVLPADVASRVLAKIASARSRELPAEAIENRALKFAARGVSASDIEGSVDQQIDRMGKSKAAIEQGRGARADGDEIEAGADAMRKGVDGAQVSLLAKTAPSGRSLAVPLFVVGSLIDRGLPSDAALSRVQDKLKARASDRELEDLPNAEGRSNKPTLTGQDMAATHRPSNAGPDNAGPPTNVPRNAGKKGNPGNGRGHRP